MTNLLLYSTCRTKDPLSAVQMTETWNKALANKQRNREVLPSIEDRTRNSKRPNRVRCEQFKRANKGEKPNSLLQGRETGTEHDRESEIERVRYEANMKTYLFHHITNHDRIFAEAIFKCL